MAMAKVLNTNAFGVAKYSTRSSVLFDDGWAFCRSQVHGRRYAADDLIPLAGETVTPSPRKQGHHGSLSTQVKGLGKFYSERSAVTSP